MGNINLCHLIISVFKYKIHLAFQNAKEFLFVMTVLTLVPHLRNVSHAASFSLSTIYEKTQGF